MVLATLNNVSLADRAKQETCPPNPNTNPPGLPRSKRMTNH